jgi:hypothetical protein
MRDLWHGVASLLDENLQARTLCAVTVDAPQRANLLRALHALTGIDSET